MRTPGIPQYPLESRSQPDRSRAFTLIELLVVFAIIGLLFAVSLPALSGLTGATSLSTATRQFSNTLTYARTEAIAGNTVTRVAVVTDWQGDSEAPYRRVSVWAWDRNQADYAIISDWQTLPDGIMFEPTRPSYLSDAQYATRDMSTVEGDYCFDSLESNFIEDFKNEAVEMQYIEFRPSGASKLEDGTYRNVVFVLTEGFKDGGSDSMVYTNRVEDGTNPRNWAQVNVDTLTGRVKILRP